MKVSVIIPSYNRARYLEASIDSVLSQTFTDIELIVIDDGSTDNTKEVVQQYGNKVIYEYIPNSGVAGARNHGMKMARGEYIAYLDSDDLYYPNKVELQVSFLDKFKDAGMVYTEFSGFDDKNFSEYRHLKKYHKSAYLTGALSYEDIFRERFPVSTFNSNPDYASELGYIGEIFENYLYNTIIFTNSMMYRKSVQDEIGLQNPDFGFFHDLEYALRICKHYPVGFIDIPTYKLRYHATQISTLDRKNATETAAKLQSDLLKVTEYYGKKDTNYYNKYRKKVDRQLARLARSVAIPLMDYCGNDNKARNYLDMCKSYGHPEYFLWTLTYLPHLLRRVAFKLASIKKSFIIRNRIKSVSKAKSM